MVFWTSTCPTCVRRLNFMKYDDWDKRAKVLSPKNELVFFVSWMWWWLLITPLVCHNVMWSTKVWGFSCRQWVYFKCHKTQILLFHLRWNEMTYFYIDYLPSTGLYFLVSASVFAESLRILLLCKYWWRLYSALWAILIFQFIWFQGIF